ncbi:MAG: hypothetical protein E7453_01140 [Ruminococcaceae bacterium]|nr:hypothetical protein [Oscillospiraceae bacterium]
MKKYISLIGRRFDRLEVVVQTESTLRGQRQWLCKCDCGGTCVVTTANLNRGHTTSCGCKKSPDLTGKVFGKLEVLGRADQRNPRGERTTPMWECRCECGEITYKATDTLKNPDISMCSKCASKYAVERARVWAGFVDGTQITKIKNMKLTAANTSGVRGVSFEKRSGKWRARLKFKGETINLGIFDLFEEAVSARKQAEMIYLGEFLKEKGLELKTQAEE